MLNTGIVHQNIAAPSLGNQLTTPRSHADICADVTGFYTMFMRQRFRQCIVLCGIAKLI
jgi:hypothetical protein